MREGSDGRICVDANMFVCAQRVSVRKYACGNVSTSPEPERDESHDRDLGSESLRAGYSVFPSSVQIYACQGDESDRREKSESESDREKGRES